MNKEEILKRFKAEGVDEGRDHINRKGDDAGIWGLAFLSLLIMIYQGVMKVPLGDIPAILFCFLSIGAFSRYKDDKEKTHLALGVITGIACLACLGCYVWQTMM